MDPAAWAGVPDEELVDRVRAGDGVLYGILIRRHNQRVYRVARSILRNDADAEDVMQETYVRAYEHLNQFAGQAKFSTWLTKIAVHESLGRARRQARTTDIEPIVDTNSPSLTTGPRDPERQAYDRELKVVLERAIEALPESYRCVFVLRAVEELNVADTAWCLGIGQEAVKTRLHRARSFLRKELHRRAGVVAAEAFPLHLAQCDRVVEATLRRIGSV